MKNSIKLLLFGFILALASPVFAFDLPTPANDVISFDADVNADNTDTVDALYISADMLTSNSSLRVIPCDVHGEHISVSYSQPNTVEPQLMQLLLPDKVPIS